MRNTFEKVEQVVKRLITCSVIKFLDRIFRWEMFLQEAVAVV